MAKTPRLNTSRLRGKMAEKGITQIELAKELGIVPSSLSRKMTGKTDFSLTEALTIVRVLGGGSVDDYFFIS